MGNISLFKKKENTSPSGREDYLEKIKSHKFVLFWRGLLITVVIIGAITIAHITMKNKTYSSTEVASSAEISIQTNVNVEPFDNHILTYSKDGASCINSSGTAVWNETFEMQNPMCNICQNTVAIGDYNGRNIYIMNTEEVLGHISTTKPIKDFCTSANGVVAVVLDDTDATLIYMYDKEGNELVHFRTTMKESGYPACVSISPSGELVCVSFLFVDGNAIKSSVAFYNFGEVGQNSTDNYVSGYDYVDKVVPITRFFDDKNAFAVADDRVMFYSGAQKPVSIAERLQSESIQRVYYGEDYVGLVFNSTVPESKYRLDLYDKEGNLAGSIEINMDFSDVILEEDQVIIYNESTCKIYGINGKEKYNGYFEKSVYMVIPTTKKNKLTLVTADSIDTIELK